MECEISLVHEQKTFVFCFSPLLIILKPVSSQFSHFLFVHLTGLGGWTLLHSLPRMYENDIFCNELSCR